MSTEIAPLATEDHAYAVELRGHVAAHVWWDADPARRACAGWYLRDLRRPAVVVRLPAAGGPAGALAADTHRPAAEWAAAADALARRSTRHALREARCTVLEAPYDCYEVHVAGVTHRALAAAFPDLAVHAAPEVEIVHGRLDSSGLADVLNGARRLGGVVTGVARVAPRLS
jgi:hypothetical protein